jgi:hypothetical protein
LCPAPAESPALCVPRVMLKSDVFLFSIMFPLSDAHHMYLLLVIGYRIYTCPLCTTLLSFAFLLLLRSEFPFFCLFSLCTILMYMLDAQLY